MDVGLGVCLPAAASLRLGVAGLTEVAQAAEAAGVATLWLADDPSNQADATTAAGALAVAPVTLGIGVLADVGAGRAPSVLAKEVTAVDHLSAGRAALALGWGPWDGGGPVPGRPAPGRAGGVAGLAARAAVLDEAATVCRRLFTGSAVTFDGAHLSLAGAVNLPPPVRPGGPPLLLRMVGRDRTLASAVRTHAGVVSSGDRASIERTRRAAAAAASGGAPGPGGAPGGVRPAVVVWRSWGTAPAPAVVADVADLLAGPADGVIVALPAPAAGRRRAGDDVRVLVAACTDLGAALRADRPG